MRPLLVLSCCAGLAIASCHKPSQPTANQSGPAAEAGPVKGVDRTHRGRPSPPVSFSDPDGNPIGLGNFVGKPTLVNLWASWCAPCVKELPTLDRLAKAQGSAMNVIAVSQDSGPHASVVAFLQGHRIVNLDAYQDPKMGLSGAFGAEVLPTSVLIDSNGKEVWRYVGDLDWNSREAAKLLAEGGVDRRP